jgi:hypothetical protein
MNYYDKIIREGYWEFDNQSECEDFIRWAIDEIQRLRKDNDKLSEEISWLNRED